MQSRIPVVTTPQPDHQSLIIELVPLILFGFGAMILDLFDIPGAIECKSLLTNGTYEDLYTNHTQLRDVRDEAITDYNLIEAYAILKGTYIAIQVSRKIPKLIHELASKEFRDTL